jgi:hypothetical protein
MYLAFDLIGAQATLVVSFSSAKYPRTVNMFSNSAQGGSQHQWSGEAAL